MFLNYANAQSMQGPLTGGTFINDGTIGTIYWNQLTNAASSDDAYANSGNMAGANCTSDPFRITKYLKATKFGFYIPTGATIDGISVTIERNFEMFAACVGKSYCMDNSVTMVKGGAFTGTDYANSIKWVDDSTVTYGGSTDLWGTTWTPAEINDPDFGVGVSLKAGYYAGYYNFGHIDNITITVYYSSGVTGFHGIPSLNISKPVLYPNPAGNNISLGYSCDRQGQTTLQVVDVLGRIVRSFTKISSQGVNHADVDLGDLEEGAYSIILRSENEYSISRFIKKN